MAIEAEPGTQEIRAQLGRIAASSVFIAAPQISRLLSFLVEASLREEPLKESIVGVSFFNRPLGYDPQKDPVVRTEVRRLRLKLSEYYVTEGKADHLLIEIPQGGYKAKFSSRERSAPEVVVEPATESSSVPAERLRNPMHNRRVVKAIAASLVLIAAGLMLANAWTSRQRSFAVLPLRDVDGETGRTWVGSLLSETIMKQLSATQKLRAVPLKEETFAGIGRPDDAVLLSSADLTQIRTATGADLLVTGSFSPLRSRGPKTYRVDLQIYDTRRGKLAGSDTESGDMQNLFAMVSLAAAAIGRQVGVDTNGALPEDPLDARNASVIEPARALCLRAEFTPAGPDKEALYRRALDVSRKKGSGPWEIIPLNGLAKIYAAKKDFQNAADYFRQSYVISMALNGQESATTLEAELAWARARARSGEQEEAIAQMRDIVPRAQRSLAGEPWRLWNILHDVVHGCNEAKAYRDAESITLQALTLNERMQLPPTSERWGMLYWDLGRAKRGQQQYSEALAAFEKAKMNFQFPDSRIEQVNKDIELTNAIQLKKAKVHSD